MAGGMTKARGGRKGGDRKSKSARAGSSLAGSDQHFLSDVSIGVLFSVPRFHRYIKKSTPKSRVTMAAAVYTAAVVRNMSSTLNAHAVLVLDCRLNT